MSRKWPRCLRREIPDVPSPRYGSILAFPISPARLNRSSGTGSGTNKPRYLGSRGTYVYRGRVNPGGQEKGVDVSIAVDLVELTYEQMYEVAIIVSQDWDFGPAIRLAKRIAHTQGRYLIFESAFPYKVGVGSSRGVPGTEWVHIDKAMYDACHDPTDYRP